MAWERRGDDRCYYYRSRRVDGRVVRDYFGSGAVGQFAADIIAEARDRQADLIRAREAERARLDGLDGAVDQLDQACELMTEAVLTAGGLTDARRRRRGTAATDKADQRTR